MTYPDFQPLPSIEDRKRTLAKLMRTTADTERNYREWQPLLLSTYADPMWAGCIRTFTEKTLQEGYEIIGAELSSLGGIPHRLMDPVRRREVQMTLVGFMGLVPGNNEQHVWTTHGYPGINIAIHATLLDQICEEWNPQVND